MLDRFAQIPDREKAKKLESVYHQRLNERNSELELQRNLNLNYRYVRIWTEKGMASVNFGWKESAGTFTYSVALQSVKDNFSKKEARKVINRRYADSEIQQFTFKSENTIRDIGPLLTFHYNNTKEIAGVVNVPKYLKKINIELGW